jgi:dihydrofolate reductase
MRARVSSFIATSLDGYIARPDGSIDWLTAVQTLIPDGEDCGYLDFMSSIDCLVMGRHTFEQASAFDEWPYGDLPVIVLSRAPVAIPPLLAASVRSSQESPQELVARLTAERFRHIYVDGGHTIQSFLRAGLLDAITITLIPLLLGAGRPLFGPLPHDVKLDLIGTQAYEFGFVQVTYRIESSA